MFLPDKTIDYKDLFIMNLDLTTYAQFKDKLIEYCSRDANYLYLIIKEFENVLNKGGISLKLANTIPMIT